MIIVRKTYKKRYLEDRIFLNESEALKHLEKENKKNTDKNIEIKIIK